MKALDRVNELMLLAMRDLPAPALAYARYLCAKFGSCGEVWATAFYHYAELVEGAEKIEDSLYAVTDEARAFFAGYAAASEAPNAPHEGPARASCAGPLDAVVGRHTR